MPRFTFWSLKLVLLTLSSGVALGQQVATDPASTHIFPAGGRRGTVVDVRVGGECLPPMTRLRVVGEGVHAPQVLGPRAEPRGEPSLRRKPGELHINYPKEWSSQMEIAADAPPGPCFWWLACARGGTSARVFLVGDLPEFIETESNSLPERAESVELPVTVNGQIAGERDMDYFRFTAKAGEVVVADVMAGRLGSPLETLVEFRDATGKRLVVQETRVGSDPVVALRVPANGEYQLLVANLGAPGGPHFVYRINLSQVPYARLAFPSGGSAGQTQRCELLTLTGTPAWGQIAREVSLDPLAGSAWWQPPGLQQRLSLDVGRQPEVIAPESGDDAASALAISLPATVNGRLDTARDEDWYRFEARQGEPLTIACRPAGEGLPILPILSIHDANGGVLATASALETPERRPSLEAWSPPASGSYWLRIRDVQQGVAGGEEFVYRVAIQPAIPDFELTMKTDAANHVQASRTELDVAVTRRGGFSGPVQVAVKGLPTGVRAEPLEIPANALAGKLILVSDESALPPPEDALLQIVGSANIDGTLVSHPATMPHQSRDAEGVSVGPASVDRFHLTVQNKPLFRLYCSEAYQYAHRGTIYPYLMEVERLNGFNGPIRLQIADRQNKDLDGVDVLEVTIPAEQRQIMLPIYLPETMHINVQAHSNIYAQGIATFHDALGRVQSTCVVSEMRCMVRTLPTVAHLHSVDREITLRRGEVTRCRLWLDRTPLFNGPMTVALTNPAPGSGILVAPVRIPAGENEAAIELHLAADAQARDVVNLRLRGTGDLGDGATVVSEALVTAWIDSGQ